jgi:hypothetical protein
MRRSRNRLVPQSDWRTILDEWLAIVPIDSAQGLDLTIVDAAAHVVETLHTGKRGLRCALRRLGNTFGDLGWPLEQLNTWIVALSTVIRRSNRNELYSLESVASLAEGWAERYVRGAHSGACIDAVTGLGTPTVLRLRLKEVYAHCRAFGITPTDAYCFVVIDTNTDDLAPFERDAVMVITAGVVGDVFRSGETVVRHRGRMIVLASKSESTRHRAALLARQLLDAPITRSANPMVWNDELPISTIDLDRQLRELVG